MLRKLILLPKESACTLAEPRMSLLTCFFFPERKKDLEGKEKKEEEEEEMPVARPETSDSRVIAHVDMDCFYVQGFFIPLSQFPYFFSVIVNFSY